MSINNTKFTELTLTVRQFNFNKAIFPISLSNRLQIGWIRSQYSFLSKAKKMDNSS